MAAVLPLGGTLPTWIHDDPEFPQVKRTGGRRASQARAIVTFRKNEFTGQLMAAIFVFRKPFKGDVVAMEVWLASNYNGIHEIDPWGRTHHIPDAPKRGFYVIRQKVEVQG